MRYVIWKTVLKAIDVQDIEIPEGSVILIAREQHEELCVWFKCDSSKPLSKRRIMICGTGESAPDNARFIGTGLLYGGQLVFHVFEHQELSRIALL